MQELLFWCIVIPVMSVIGAILAFRSHRPVREYHGHVCSECGWPMHDGLNQTCEQCGAFHRIVLDLDLLYAVRGPNDWKPPHPYKLHLPHSGYQPIETGERSEPPRVPFAIFTVEEVEHHLQAIGYALDSQNRPYLLPESSPSTGYTPRLDDDPYEHEAEEYTEDVLKLPVPQVDLLLSGKEYL